MRTLLSLSCALAFCVVPVEGLSMASSGPSGSAIPFVAFRPGADFQLPEIVLQYDPAAQTGANWEEVKQPQWFEVTRPVIMGRAAAYLQEGLNRMTGRDFRVVSKADLSRGIVLTLLEGAPEDILNDAELQKALQDEPGDQYAANEAFFVRSESNRVLVVARTPAGLTDAVAELLESVEYEVLGMGPNWIHIPDHRDNPLVFALRRAGRPSFYIRALTATSGQSYGVGTIMSGLTDPADETVDTSYWRWQIGRRLYGTSMPPFPGHALQAYHRKVIETMRETGTTEGFLAPNTSIGLDVQRPSADTANKGWLWINSDPAGQAADKVYVSDGETWGQQNLGQIAHNLDLSVPLVRHVVLADMVQRATAGFAKNPDELVIFAIDPEDGGGYGALAELTKHGNWYPDYLAKEGLPFGRPYVLHGHAGLNQPKETWDPAAASDTVFGFANWLLHEFDQWIDSLPAAERLTSEGTPKRDLIRCSFYSYNYHDVPPNFNPDPRIRLMIASYPKHRGRGKWEKIASQEDVARAFQILLPREPSGDYRIVSLSYYWDPGPTGIPAGWSASPAAIAADYRRAYDAGYRAINLETDFNFGKFGLAYYLISKVLWDADLTGGELDTVRDLWFRRSFGPAWREMKAYYDFMLTENYPVNGPNSWAKAIRLIDAADKALDGGEPDAQRRVDDVKQYWYYHYLMDSGKYSTSSTEVKEYLWKGQMSYMVALHVLARRDFGTSDVKAAVGPEICAGPAHYTRDETHSWWETVLGHWRLTPVVVFSEAVLVDGRPAGTVDLNDLVSVQEFRNDAGDSPFIYNSGYMKPVPFLMVAGRKDDPIGFHLVWPFNPNDNYYVAKKVPYGVDVWNTATKTWEAWIDKTMTVQQSVEKTTTQGKKVQVVDVRLKAPRAGTYRFDIGYGGNVASLAGTTYDPVADEFAGAVGFTYYTHAEGLTQSPVYFYIPRGTRRLDLEVWDQYGNKYVHLRNGLPAQGDAAVRKIDISEMGTHTIALQPGEDGSVAMLQSNGFAFPYLYSVPTLWAKCPSALLVPRAIAKADGLTIVE